MSADTRPRRFRVHNFMTIIFLLLLIICGFSLLYDNYKANNIQKLESKQANLLASSSSSSSSSSLYSRIRIHCLITYDYGYLSSVVLVKRTWARHCNSLLFVSGNMNGELETYVPQENATEPGFLMKEGFIYAYEQQRDEADWFLKVTDWSFVVIENLRHMLQYYSPNTPIYFGFKMKDPTGKPFMFHKTGYVLSKEALRRFVQFALPNKSLCNIESSDNEFINLASCLRHVGVIAGDSRDEFGHHTFIPFVPKLTAIQNLKVETPLLTNISYYNLENDIFPISKRAISFMFDYPPDIYNYYYFIYKVRNFGVARKKLQASQSRSSSFKYLNKHNK